MTTEAATRGLLASGKASFPTNIGHEIRPLLRSLLTINQADWNRPADGSAVADDSRPQRRLSNQLALGL